MGQLRDSVQPHFAALQQYRSNPSYYLSIQTPVKQDKLTQGLRFLEPPDSQVFFRGTVRLRYNDDQGFSRRLGARRGQLGEPLVVLKMKQRDRRLVK